MSVSSNCQDFAVISRLMLLFLFLLFLILRPLLFCHWKIQKLRWKSGQKCMRRTKRNSCWLCSVIFHPWFQRGLQLWLHFPLKHKSQWLLDSPVSVQPASNQEALMFKGQEWKWTVFPWFSPLESLLQPRPAQQKSSFFYFTNNTNIRRLVFCSATLWL